MAVTLLGRLKEVKVLPAGKFTDAIVNVPPDAVPLALSVRV